MKHGPDIARVAALVGDPARANMLSALMDGRALTAGELAREAGVTAQTASSHLAKLAGAGLLARRAQGRHRYFALADDEVGRMLEAMMGVAARERPSRTRTGPKEPALREARVCYDHLAGSAAVAMMDGIVARGLVTSAEAPMLTEEGRAFFADFGVDLAALERARRPVCRACLDWSARRPHLGGGLGAALLAHFQERRWARREEGSRAVGFSPSGRAEFERAFVAC